MSNRTTEQFKAYTRAAFDGTIQDLGAHRLFIYQGQIYAVPDHSVGCGFSDKGVRISTLELDRVATMVVQDSGEVVKNRYGKETRKATASDHLVDDVHYGD